MYDAIVIGAGPAGCAAAKLLAEWGLRALLAERSKLPRYIPPIAGAFLRK